MSEPSPGARWAAPAMKARLRRRHRAEGLFHLVGAGAIALAMLSLGVLLVTIGVRGFGAFRTSEIRLDVAIPAEAILSEERIDARPWVRSALRELFPDVSDRRERRELGSLMSRGAGSVVEREVARGLELESGVASIWLPADDEVDLYRKSGGTTPGRLSERQVAWIDRLEEQGRVRSAFSTSFLSSGDSREPELAGIWGALVGSFLTLAVTLAIVFPLGVSAAIHLEEFASRSRWTDLIEVNINNLAAVPSIVFGLLGLAIFLNVLNLPRSAPLVGGLTLSLMTLPTLIIASRVSIQAVPPSIREAARGLGASPLQVVVHHVLPLAMPGILTGTIIGMARALGETAPLLMIGMVAFVVDVPGSLTDASTALPVQIFLWADSPERAFVEKTSGAILVLLLFLVAMNAVAITMRRRFEKQL